MREQLSVPFVSHGLCDVGLRTKARNSVRGAAKHTCAHAPYPFAARLRGEQSPKVELAVIIRCALLSATLLAPLNAVANSPDPFELSLEELMSVEVTSVSKRSQSQFTVAAAVHVITNEDIERAGATSLGEALRGTPGLQVARINNNGWAISGRGFNGAFANKLLVLVDGRTVYDPTFAGVFWDQQEFVMSDIERIEVIRGPGAAMWGANAVNGVINIITMRSDATRGTRVASSVGDLQTITSARYGGTMGVDANFRIYGKFSDREAFTPLSFPDQNTASVNKQIGFRIDAVFGDKDTFMVSGDILDQDRDSAITGLDPFTGLPVLVGWESYTDQANLVARWTRNSSAQSRHELQFYFSREEGISSTQLSRRV